MIFLVCEMTTGIHVKLLTAKTRVAPLKQLTIPRLELMSARVLSTLMATVIEVIGSNSKVEKVRYWLDSKTALFWIFNRGEWKLFVAHRVNEILGLTREEDWAHVAGTENPADLGSRGVSANHLRDSRLWWEGPQWLKKGEKAWPKFSLLQDTAEVGEERKKSAAVMLVTEREVKGVSTAIHISKYGSSAKLLRVTAYALRFIENLKRKKVNVMLKAGRLSVGELEAAEGAWIVDAQLSFMQDKDYGKLSVQLGLVKENEFLVCKGRLGSSDLDFRSKYPLLLPKNHPFTDLMIKDCHERVQHNKLRSTLAEFSAKFWVSQGRQQIKKVIGKCQTCRRVEGRAYRQPPASDLPEFRVTKSLPFSRTGVYFAGPLFVMGQGG